MRTRHLVLGSNDSMVALTHTSCRCRVVLAGPAVRLSVGAAQHNVDGDAGAPLQAQKKELRSQPARRKIVTQFDIFNRFVVLLYGDKRGARLLRIRCKRHFRS